MKPKHTPGPWTIGRNLNGSTIMHRKTVIAECGAADAELIAAAPAMLSLLQRLNAAIHREDVIGHFELQDVLDLDDLMKAFGKN